MVATTLDTLVGRRSVGRLGAPGPDDDQLRTILEAAAAAPDHKQLRPWRFVVLAGDAKEAFGAVLADAYRRRCAAAGVAPTEGQSDKERTKLGRAPLVVVVAATPKDGVPEVEQVASAAAAAQNALLAATALGFGSMWRTGDAAYDPVVKESLGLRREDHIVGFLYVGTVPPGREPQGRSPDLTGVVDRWAPPGS